MRSNSPDSALNLRGHAISLVLAVPFAVLFVTLSYAAELRARIDQATIIRLDSPGAEVIVGNPSIADVAVQSGRVLVVTGKSVGLTNLIVLNHSGERIYEKKVSVSVDPKHLVTLNKGVGRETYSCSPTCGPALIPGDTPVFSDELNKAIRAKLGLAQASAEGTTGQQ